MTRRMRYPKFPPARHSADWETCGSSAGIASCGEQLVAAPRGGAGTTGEVAISPRRGIFGVQGISAYLSVLLEDGLVGLVAGVPGADAGSPKKTRLVVL